MRCTSVTCILMGYTPVRCTFMRYTLMRCTPVRYTPMRLLQTVMRWSICRDLSCKTRVFALVTGWSLLLRAANSLPTAELQGTRSRLRSTGTKGLVAQPPPPLHADIILKPTGTTSTALLPAKYLTVFTLAGCTHALQAALQGHYRRFRGYCGRRTDAVTGRQEGDQKSGPFFC